MIGLVEIIIYDKGEEISSACKVQKPTMNHRQYKLFDGGIFPDTVLNNSTIVLHAIA